MTQAIDWWAISAPLCLIGAGVLALLADTFMPRWSRWLPCTLSVAGVLLGLGFVAHLAGTTRVAFCLPRVGLGTVGVADCSWVVDDVSLTWWLIVLASTGLVALLAQPSVARGDIPAGELYFLLLTSATGAMCVASSLDLVTLVVSMETVTLPSFALVALRRDGRRGGEAALKFFIASVVATAFSLLGISMIYGATGSVAAASVLVSTASSTAVSPVVGVGMILTLVGLAFKVAAVPFQVWVPDTYLGAPIPIAAYLSVVSKVAGLAGLTVVLVRFFPVYVDTWSGVVAVSAALTMTIGNVAALRQRHAVRLLAWSSVAQAGYLLVPLAAGGSPNDVGALQAYALMYALVNLGAFAAVVAASERGAVDVADFSGLVRREPLIGIGLAFSLLCLAGLPPGVIGLLAKVVIFQSAVDGDLTWLAVVLAVNVAIGLVYYLRWTAALFVPTEIRAAPLEPTISPGESPTVPEVLPVAPAEPTVVGDEASSIAVTERAETADGRDGGSTASPWPARFVVALTLVVAVVLSVVPGPIFSVMP
jgi:NADH-quinone oxidoreductase subunit N